MAFWTPQALSKLAQSESSGRADLIHYPSGYTSSGVRSSASGLYGFLDTTWRDQASRVGVDTNLYPRAYLAPADVQTQVAASTPISHWTCPGCNAVASRLATDPANVTGTPALDASSYGDYGGGGTVGGTRLTVDPNPYTSGGYNPGGYDPDLAGGGGQAGGSGMTDPDLTGGYTGTVPQQPYYDADLGGGTGSVPSGTGGDSDLGSLAGTAAGLLGGSQGQQDKTALNKIAGFGVDWLVRFGLIVLGAGLVIIAAWALLRGETMKEGAASAAKAVAR